MPQGFESLSAGDPAPDAPPLITSSSNSIGVRRWVTSLLLGFKLVRCATEGHKQIGLQAGRGAGVFAAVTLEALAGQLVVDISSTLAHHSHFGTLLREPGGVVDAKARLHRRAAGNRAPTSCSRVSM